MLERERQTSFHHLTAVCHEIRNFLGYFAAREAAWKICDRELCLFRRGVCSNQILVPDLYRSSNSSATHKRHRKVAFGTIRNPYPGM